MALVLVLALLTSTACFQAVPMRALASPAPVLAQTAFQNITSYRVSGAANFATPGNESFWRTIPWTTIPLAASVSPGGGHTTQVLVKSANDGYNIFVLLRWNDSAGPSYLGDTEVYKAKNGSLVPLDPSLTGNVTQLFYNSSYYYPDRVAMMWFLGSSDSQKSSPAMQLGTDGAITGGAAELWHWQSNPTDNNPSDSGFPGGYTTPGGKPMYPQDNLSFAEDDYANMTGFYVVAGSFGRNASNLDPYADPYSVRVGSQYSTMDKAWTVEMVRAFTISDASQYRVQLLTGSTYYVAFAVWQGRLGESSQLKSVSQWYSIRINDSTPTSSQTTSTTTVSTVTVTGETPTITGGVTFSLALVTAVATLIIGLVAGMLARPTREASGK